MTLEALNSWSASLTALGLAVLWQSALLAGLVAGVCLLLRRSSPTVRYWCWQVLALKLLLMPWWTLAVPLPGFPGSDPGALLPSSARGEAESRIGGLHLLRAKTPVAQPAGEVGPSPLLSPASPPALDLLDRVTWRSWLALVWLVGFSWHLGRLLVQRGRLRRLLNRSAPATELNLLVLVSQAAEQLGLRRPPAVLLADLEGSPFVCGLLRPVLVLPRGLLTALDADQWRQVLLHELAHLKRRDLWWGWVPEIARLVYFFHPVSHWVCARIRLERELACDQLAMALSGRGAADYALVLVQVVSFASQPPALAAERASPSGPDGGDSPDRGEPPNKE
jgi:beta-lactamase regulating signal transducer with metallopeptidase domain